MSGLHTIFQKFTVAKTEERDREGGGERESARESLTGNELMKSGRDDEENKRRGETTCAKRNV